MRKENILIAIFVLLFGLLIFFIALRGPEDDVFIEEIIEIEESAVENELEETDTGIDLLERDIREMEEDIQTDFNMIEKEIREMEESLGL